MRPWHILLIGCAFVFFLPGKVEAADSNFQLKILPIDCVFEVVNDGSNELHYVTPEACGQFVPPSTNNIQPIQTPTLITDFGFPILNVVQSEEQNEGNIILLDNFPRYFSDTGRQLSLRVNQTVYLLASTDHGVERHSITIKEIGSNYVIITVASTPFDSKLFVGETKQYDVTGNKNNDIEVTLNSIKNNVANITFRKLSQASNNKLPQGFQGKSESGMNGWLYILFGILSIVTVLFVLRKNRSK